MFRLGPGSVDKLEPKAGAQFRSGSEKEKGASAGCGTEARPREDGGVHCALRRGRGVLGAAGPAAPLQPGH